MVGQGRRPAGAALQSGDASATGTSSGSMQHSTPAVVLAFAPKTLQTASGLRATSGTGTRELRSPCAFRRQVQLSRSARDGFHRPQVLQALVQLWSACLGARNA